MTVVDEPYERVIRSLLEERDRLAWDLVQAQIERDWLLTRAADDLRERFHANFSKGERS